MSADRRVLFAREYLAGARQRKVTELPPSLLIRECGELRRALGQALDVIEEHAGRLADLAGQIEARLANEHADRQIICEDAAAELRRLAAGIGEGQIGGAR